MASSSEKSSTSRSTSGLMPGRVVIAYDATKNPNAAEFKRIIANIQMCDEMIQEVDTITLLGVLHQVLHPMGFQMQIGPDSFIGTSVRAIKEEVSRMVDTYVGMLTQSAEECERYGVVIEVKIVVGAPMKNVIIQEAVASNATWVVLNRHLKKESRFYLKHLPCKVALVLDNFSLEVLRPHHSNKATSQIEHKLFYSLSKLVPTLPDEYNAINEHSLISPSYRGSISSQESSDSEKSSFASSLTSKSKEQSFYSPDEFSSYPHLEKSGSDAKVKDKHVQKQSPLSISDFTVFSPASEIQSKLDSGACNCSEVQIATDDFSSGNVDEEDSNVQLERQSDYSKKTMQNRRFQMDFGDTFMYDEMKMEGLDSKGLDYSEIQIAKNDFSSDNLLGEGGYGVVYKGQLKDGQLIIVKVQKEANTQRFSEYSSEIRVLRSVCHKNIVMLLGYCCKENLNVLVYEYICNKSLEWHLFDNTERVLEWHRRCAIAIGIAKGLRYLHEESRGNPVIHRDLRPSNILLTHEFVPLLADCGLAKWRTNKFDIQKKTRGTLEYLAPEYADNSVCCVKTDVFAFGIVLIQLISGRRTMDSTRDDKFQSLRQWAMPLIERLALEELVDRRLGDSYSAYELYQMARAAYLCIQNKPAMRPSLGEILHFLEGENDNLRHLTEQFIPHLSNVQRQTCRQALIV